MKFSMERPVKIVMLGAGGTGGYIAPHLYRLLYSLERPVRFIICDGDVVEEKNLVRQNFIPADLGENKAKVLAERYSTVFGMETEYVPDFVESEERLKKLIEPQIWSRGTYSNQTVSEQVILIGAVDNNRSRQLCHKVFYPQADAASVIQHLEEGDLIRSSRDLVTLEIQLTDVGRAFRLSKVLKQLSAQYDYIIIDSPPALGILTVNILTASNGVIVPALSDIFSLQGVGELFTTIQSVKEYCNPNLQLYGILMTRLSERRILDRSMREMLDETAQQMGTRVFAASIREAVAVREASAERQSIFAYAPRSNQAKDYERFMEEYLALEQQGIWG